MVGGVIHGVLPLINHGPNRLFEELEPSSSRDKESAAKGHFFVYEICSEP